MTIGHRDRVASNVGDAARRMISRQNVQAAIWRQTLTPLAEFRGAQRTIRIVNPNLGEPRNGCARQKHSGRKTRTQAQTSVARKDTLSKISTRRGGAA
jgi:hypothetical protein